MAEQLFQILSLDGGGIKGLFSAAVLAAIEEDLTTNVVDHFDLITGTSTGGIIALGLASGMRPREIVEFYLSKGPRIFGKAWGLRWLQHWLRRKYSQTPLREALQSCFKDKRIADCTKRVVIPSYNLGDDDDWAPVRRYLGSAGWDGRGDTGERNLVNSSASAASGENHGRTRPQGNGHHGC